MHPVDPYVEAALQALEQAPPSPDYVLGPKHPPSPDYVPGPEEPEQAPLSPDYVPEPEYLERTLRRILPTILPMRGDDADDESSDDDDDEDDDDEEQEVSKDVDGEEEYPALTDSFVVPAVDPVSLAKDIEAFGTNESAPTPIPSPPLPLPSPHTTSPTYAKAPLGYKAVGIRLRDASPSTHHLLEIPSPPLLLPSTTHRDDLLKANMPLRKRTHFTTPTGRFEVGESSSAAAARQVGHTLAHIVDYGLIDTMDASICASKSIAMIAIGVVNDKVSILRRDRRYFCSMASPYKREAVISRHAWSHSESRIQAMEAQIRALLRDVDVLQRQRIRVEDRLTAHI
ncbi:hypothetical protein Tco_1542849 [Tanacetum coccineum]